MSGAKPWTSVLGKLVGRAADAACPAAACGGDGRCADHIGFAEPHTVLPDHANQHATLAAPTTLRTATRSGRHSSAGCRAGPYVRSETVDKCFGKAGWPAADAGVRGSQRFRVATYGPARSRGSERTVAAVATLRTATRSGRRSSRWRRSNRPSARRCPPSWRRATRSAAGRSASSASAESRTRSPSARTDL